MHARRIAAGLVLSILGLPASASAQYTLTVTDGVAPLGGTATVSVVLDNEGDPLQGYQWGLCHDSFVSVEEGDVSNGAALAGITFTFQALQFYESGWTVGALFNAVTNETLPPGNDLELFTIDYTAETKGTAILEFCEVLGDPEVQVAVVAENTEIEPVQVSGTIESGGTAPFVLSAAEVTSPQGLSVDVAVELSGPEPMDAFTFGLTHASLHLSLDSIVAGSVVAGLNDGEGADYFVVNVSPSGALDGGTVGCVASFGAPFDRIPAGDPQEVCIFTYTVSPSAPDETPVALRFSSSLGSPPVPVVVSVGGFSETPVRDDGEVLIMGIPIPVFVRGDANGDGALDISDPFFLALHLFVDGPGPQCSVSGDANDDATLSIADAIFALDYLFQSGPSPAAPFPDCGPDADETDALLCEISNEDTCQ